MLQSQYVVEQFMKNKNRFHFFSLLSVSFFLVGLIGCNYQENKALDRGLVMEANFASINENILQGKCMSCHSGSEAPHGIELSSYSLIMDNALFPPLVVPGKPEESSLYTSITTGDMPMKAPKLSEVEIQSVYNWIKNGAKEFEQSVTPVDPPPPPPPTAGWGIEPCDLKKWGKEPGFLACEGSEPPVTPEPPEDSDEDEEDEHEEDEHEEDDHEDEEDEHGDHDHGEH